MDDLWNDAVKKAIEEKGLTVKELAEKLDKSEAEVEKLISKEGRATIEELYELSDVLELDINELFHLSTEDIQILLTYELQAMVNGISRTIPEAKRPYFLRALLYLAQCFREL